MKTRNLNNMYNDINILKEKVGLYYTQYGKIPVLEDVYTNTNNINNINPNDNEKYYVIDMQALENVTLNFGKDYQTYKENQNPTLTDLYIINEQSHNVYYVQGIELDGNIYYTIPGDYTKVEVPTVSQVKLSKMNQNVATLEINAVNKSATIQSIILYVNDNEYKTFEYTGQRHYVDITLPFYEETACYIKVINTNGESTESEKITIKNEDTIATAIDMNKLATVVNSGENFEGKTIEMINDIDLEGSATNQWTPIGNIEKVFAGTFDGNENAINNIYIDTRESVQGVFGCVTGTIKNLGVETGTIKTGGTSGAVVGYCVGGKIEKCYNRIDICMYENCHVAGVVGYLSNASVIRCYNTGNIQGDITIDYGNISGIAGYLNNSKAEYCYNTGNITATSGKVNTRVSGISAGSYSTIKSCYNTGDINIQSDQNYTVAAGIYAQMNNVKMYNCYNIGKTTVTTANNYSRNGGLTGYFDSNATMENCYWLSTVSPVGVVDELEVVTEEDYEAIQIDTEEKMKNIASRLGSDFKEDTNNINNGFPILAWQEK